VDTGCVGREALGPTRIGLEEVAQVLPGDLVVVALQVGCAHGWLLRSATVVASRILPPPSTRAFHVNPAAFMPALAAVATTVE
jgi:hypothetical protein